MKVSVLQVLELLEHHFEERVTYLFWQNLTSTNFLYKRKVLRPCTWHHHRGLLSKHCTEYFEQKVLSTATLKQACWYRHVNKMLAIWPHGEELQNFLRHLNNIHHNIMFTMKTEKNNYLSMMYWWKNMFVGIYGLQKTETHIDHYLQECS
jgi:hypothetical protein